MTYISADIPYVDSVGYILGSHTQTVTGSAKFGANLSISRLENPKPTERATASGKSVVSM
jgi:hypothetical protein